MALNEAFVGRSFPAAEPFGVGREKIREFATAIGDDNPLFSDLAAARAAGYGDLLAPPTFAVTVVASAQDRVWQDPDLGLDFSRVVHRDQQFRYHRPIVAGDELAVEVVVDGIRTLAGNDVLVTRAELTAPDGTPVASATCTLLARGTA